MSTTPSILPYLLLVYHQHLYQNVFLVLLARRLDRIYHLLVLRIILEQIMQGEYRVLS